MTKSNMQIFSSILKVFSLNQEQWQLVIANQQYIEGLQWCETLPFQTREGAEGVKETAFKQYSISITAVKNAL